MPYASKKLRISKRAKVRVILGYRKASFYLELPVQALADQIARAAYGKHAHIVIGKRGGSK